MPVALDANTRQVTVAVEDPFDGQTVRQVQLLVGAGADVSMQDRYRARHLRSRMAVQPHALCRNGSNVLAVAPQCEHDACAQYFNKRCRCARQRIDHSESLFYSTELHGLGTLGADLALDNDL
jgi:hypothetical protein